MSTPPNSPTVNASPATPSYTLEVRNVVQSSPPAYERCQVCMPRDGSIQASVHMLLADHDPFPVVQLNDLTTAMRRKGVGKTLCVEIYYITDIVPRSKYYLQDLSDAVLEICHQYTNSKVFGDYMEIAICGPHRVLVCKKLVEGFEQLWDCPVMSKVDCTLSAEIVL